MERNLSLLLVDPSEDARQFIKDQVFGEDLDIIEVDNGELAWNVYKSVIPNIVITEIALSKMSGFELSQAIRDSSIDKLSTNSPFVVAFSALDDEFTKYWALSQGFHTFISKSCPQGYEELIKIIKDHLNKIRTNKMYI